MSPVSSDTETGPVPRKVKASTKHRVRRVTPEGNDPVVFSHEDRGVVRNFVKKNHPRGLEVYTEAPDGTREHYSSEQDFQGSDNGGWVPLTDEDLDGE